MESRTHHEGKVPELLAPAGSPEAFTAAVAAGADAVYLSGKRFGARKFAQNFSEPEIEETVEFAHSRGVKVYVTVNILVHDREINEAMEYLIRLHAMGVDAVLLQDPGIASLARKIVPGLVIHASTQLTITSAEGVRWAHSLGFSRVVLARELPLAEIERIARETSDTGIGLEVFAHGALCYCYSGQCLLSSVIGGRSGNRGMCAQPCRKKYTLVTGKTDRFGRPTGLSDIRQPGPYLLSPKDLCTYPEISRLARSPVVSLKIEGRMKSPEYVAVVVSGYRRALDAAGTNRFSPEDSVIDDMLLAFNRGFTKGYLFSDRGKGLMARDRPDNRGLPIGTVLRYDRRNGTAAIRLDRPVTLRPGDGVLFSPPGHPDKEWGFSINSEPAVKPDETEVVVPRPVEKNDRVFLTSSVDLAARARQVIKQAKSGRQPRPASVAILAKVGTSGDLTISGIVYPPGREPVPLAETSTLVMEPARTAPVTREQLSDQLCKSGGTPLAISKFDLMYDGRFFAPVREINRVRRDFFQRAEKALAAAYRPAPEEIAQAKESLAHWSETNSLEVKWCRPKPKKLGIILFADTLETIENGLVSGAETVCFEPRSFLVPGERQEMISPVEKDLRDAIRVCASHKARLIWKLPHITRAAENDAIRATLPLLHENGLDCCMAENPGSAYAVAESVPGISLAGGMGLNIFNAETVRAFSPLQFSLTVLSPELSGPEIALLARSVRSRADGPQLAIYAQGNLDTMITEDNLFSEILTDGNGRTWWGIRDETGHLFPVRTDSAGRTHIFNAAETCLIDRIGNLVRGGIDALVIDARGKTPEYAREMVSIYREALAVADQDTGQRDQDKEFLRDRVKAIALGGITAGHYTRGVRDE